MNTYSDCSDNEEEEEIDTGEELTTISNVIGPFKFTHSISEDLYSTLIDAKIEFFVTLDLITTTFNNYKNYTLYGSYIYSANSSLAAVALHQGVIMIKPKNNAEFNIECSRVYNTYDDNFNLISNNKFLLKKNDKICGVNILVQFISERETFDSVKLNDIKSRPYTKLPMVGMLFLYGEPVFSDVKCFDQSMLEGVQFMNLTSSEDIRSDNRWLIFGRSGEIMHPYSIYCFLDDDKPIEEWVSTKLKKSSLYFDTNTNRYEFCSMSINKSFRFSRLLINDTIYSIRNEMTPVKDDKKEILEDDIEWKNIIWGVDGVTINGNYYGPFNCFHWVKRRRG